jgi:hypothetical protein
MRSIRRTLRRPSFLPKTERNRAVLSRTHSRTMWRSEIHSNLRIDADALNRRRRRFGVRRTMYHIYTGQRRKYAGKCACVYGISSVKKEIENQSSYRLYFQPNLT